MSKMKRFKPSDLPHGEERYELEAAFGADTELVDLTDLLRAAAQDGDGDN